MLYLCSRNNSRDGGIGRHEGLKIPWPVMAVRVRVPLAAQNQSLTLHSARLFANFKQPKKEVVV